MSVNLLLFFPFHTLTVQFLRYELTWYSIGRHASIWALIPLTYSVGNVFPFLLHQSLSTVDEICYLLISLLPNSFSPYILLLRTFKRMRKSINVQSFNLTGQHQLSSNFFSRFILVKSENRNNINHTSVFTNNIIDCNPIMLYLRNFHCMDFTRVFWMT